MTKNNLYRVIKCESDRFIVDVDGEFLLCASRKKIKDNKNIVVGDLVKVNLFEKIIEEVEPRQNSLIRPLVSNVDQLVAIIAPLPRPDFFLIDKLIINAMRQNLKVVVCVNKTDIDPELFEEIKTEYSFVVKKIISTSAKNGEVEELEKTLKGKLSALAGQSAVGKSSLINSLRKNEILIVGELSQKGQKGKNTTTKSQLIRLKKNTYIIDTPGFYNLDIHDIEHYDLKTYYPEFTRYADKCKFSSCTHTTEPDCEIKKMVDCEKINYDRYARYVHFFMELKSIKKY
ncbi:MAG: ribosome small subunit-dependent GTPase A [Firmicutes bacterium]|nr:ribosome small subunit-dependent GTPase A [Bacillota bacterium]